MGFVKQIEVKENKGYIFGVRCNRAEQIRMSGSDVVTKNNKWIPVKREETSMYLSKYKLT